jgi:hypothetical protein
VVNLRGAGKPWLVGRQRLADDRGKTLLTRRVDDARWIHTSNRRILHDVVRAVQQFLDEIGARAEGCGKAPVHAFDGVCQRDRHVALGLQVDLDEPLGSLAQKAGFLFDDHHPPRGTDDHEIGFAEHREALVEPRPVHAVIHGVIVGQGPFQQRKGFALARRGAGGSEVLPVVGDNAGHAVPRHVRVRPLYATHMPCRHRPFG